MEGDWISSLAQINNISSIIAGVLGIAGGALWLQLRKLQKQHYQTLSELEINKQRNALDLQKIQEQSQQIEEKDELLERHQQELMVIRTQFASSQARLDEVLKHQSSHQELMALARQELTQEFTKVAGKVINDNSQQVQQRHQQTLEMTLTPFKDQLGQFRKTVEQAYDKDFRDRAQLVAEIQQLKALNLKMSDDATNLTNALKGEQKTQGAWGELVLERVLEEAGLRQGIEYDTQTAFQGISGERLIPDVVVKLPEERHIIIDAKVSLTAYERYCSSEDTAEIDQALKQHLQSIKQHIQSLSKKGYEQIGELKTVDFVLIFIPIESAFFIALQNDPSLLKLAYQNNIILVSPTTLLATLRTVQSIWRYERQNQNAHEIATQAGLLHDQFVLVMESLEDVGKQLGRSQAAYDKAVDRFSRGRGNLIKRSKDLEALGAKTKKKFSSALLEKSESEEEILSEE